MFEESSHKAGGQGGGLLFPKQFLEIPLHSNFVLAGYQRPGRFSRIYLKGSQAQGHCDL